MIPLAHYSGKNSNDSNPMGWYAYGSTTNNFLYSFQGGSDGTNDGYGQNQLLLPKVKKCSYCTGSTSFSPGGSFGIVNSYPGYTDYSDDAKNFGGWHDMRAYPAKDANGAVIPGAWLIGDDIGGVANNSAKNWDYQDMAYLLINATPDTTKKQPVGGVQSATLQNFNGNQGGIAGTGFTSAQANKTNTSLISFANGNLQVRTSGQDSNTTHTNALAVGVMSGDKFRITSRLVGPFDAINAGEEQQAIFWGPSPTQYVKAEVEWQPTGRKITYYIQNGTGTGTYFAVDLPANATTVDLRISVDTQPQQGAYYNGDPRVNFSYAINGGGFTQFGTTQVIPSSWISANVQAGIMTSHQNGGSPFTATYQNFLVVRDY